MVLEMLIYIRTITTKARQKYFQNRPSGDADDTLMCSISCNNNFKYIHGVPKTMSNFKTKYRLTNFEQTMEKDHSYISRGAIVTK